MVLLLLSWASCVLYHSNYNHSRVNEHAFFSEAVTIPIRHLSGRTPRPVLLEESRLKKYALRDTDYRAEDTDLGRDDQYFLYQMQPPEGMFATESIKIDNYRALEARKF